MENLWVSYGKSILPYFSIKSPHLFDILTGEKQSKHDGLIPDRPSESDKSRRQGYREML